MNTSGHESSTAVDELRSSGGPLFVEVIGQAKVDVESRACTKLMTNIGPYAELERVGGV